MEQAYFYHSNVFDPLYNKSEVGYDFVNEDILGSMEFACKLAGTKLVVVLGHTSCGAVKGACDDAKLGNLTGMLNKNCWQGQRTFLYNFIKKKIFATKDTCLGRVNGSGSLNLLFYTTKHVIGQAICHMTCHVTKTRNLIGLSSCYTSKDISMIS